VRVALGVGVLATATACGGTKVDAYEHSLARGSEHVELRGYLLEGGRKIPMRGSGDFTNAPDRGRLTFVVSGTRFNEVFANQTVYVQTPDGWVSQAVSKLKGPETPAQMLRARLPAKVVDGLVRSLEIRGDGSFVTATFSRYGEHVSVTVPRVKGSK
jgi:hypothetical protein